MNTTEQIMEEYRSAVRKYIRQSQGKDSVYKHVHFYEGRMSGLEVALGILGIDSTGIRDMYKQCKEETLNELAQEAYTR